MYPQITIFSEYEEILLALLKKGKLFSYADEFLPIQEIRNNFDKCDELKNKEILKICVNLF